MTARSALVIGAGIGGITAAIHLANAGLHVTVLDKNEQPGGRCGHLVRDGHTFDTGPTLFVMRLLYEAEFRALGAPLQARLDLRRVDPTYRLVFDDASQLALTSDMTSMRDQLETIEPGSFDAFRRYLEEGGRHYAIVLEKLVNRGFRRPSDFFNLQALGLLRLKPFVNHYRNMAAYFDSPRLKSAFTFQDLYVGLSPFGAPATFSLLPYTEFAHGVWYPRGGMYSIVETLVQLAQEAGVEFSFGSTVSQINTNGHRARGVRLADGSQIAADVVVANADLPYVYQHLLPDHRAARALSRKQFSSSSISFLWGLDRTYEALGPHTLFLADDYRENFDRIVRDLTLHTNPSLYVHAPARLDPAMAPPGQDTVTAIVPVGHLSDDGRQDWAERRDRARQHVFRRLRALGITDIQAHIKFEEVYTPVSWAERHNLAKGSTHGLSHTLTQMAYFRPSNRHRRYRNLYFVGASTHPGTGVPIAMVSGRLAAERIAAEQP
jgi:phytoene desaturase (3,4-didehydrolycopene-forming)